MGDRRSSLADVLTLEQYRSLLRTAARIEDKEESITIFFFLVVLGRCGLRIGEAIHMTIDWFKSDREVITIPPYEECECGYCRHLAQKLADNNGDMTFEEALDKYWQVKGDSHGDVPVQTERAKEIIQLYFEEVPYTAISYSTVRRRLQKIAKLTDGVDADQVYGHMLRATSATHDLWAGARPPSVDIKYRWEDEKTKERYSKKTALWAAKDLARLRDGDPTDTFEYRNNPPTYTELRPDDEDELITVESWTVDTDVPQHPRYEDDEEWIQDHLDDEQETIDDYMDEKPRVFLDPITVTTAATVRRLTREWDSVTDGDDEWGWRSPTETTKAVCGMVGMLGLAGTLLGSTGVYIDPMTLETSVPVQALPPLVLGSAIGSGNVLWADYRARIRDVKFTDWAIGLLENIFE